MLRTAALDLDFRAYVPPNVPTQTDAELRLNDVPADNEIHTHLISLGFLHDTRLSYGPSKSANCLVQGDNLSVLCALRPLLENSIRCIYLDPPYNNQETYSHYVDELSHEVWLDQISQRLAVLTDLLSPDGSVWISIDDREMHYLKVHADTIFGRTNFVTTVVWEHRTTRENRRAFSNNHEYILVYAKDSRLFKQGRSLLAPPASLLSRYKNPDGDPRGLWQSVSANAQAGHGTRSQFYPLPAPNGVVHCPPPGRCWVYSIERMQKEIAVGNVWFGKDGNGVPRLKKFLNGAAAGLTPETLWSADSVGTTDQAKKHILSLFPNEEVFDTPKPETLIERILQIATMPGDLVLDPYLGSGTTTAVAHMMGRKYIGIERGQHSVSLCAKRMRHVAGREASRMACSPSLKGAEGFGFYRAPRKWT